MDNFYSKLFLLTHGLNIVVSQQISEEVLRWKRSSWKVSMSFRIYHFFFHPKIDLGRGIKDEFF